MARFHYNEWGHFLVYDVFCNSNRGGSRNSLRGGGGVLGQNSSKGGLGSRSVGIFIY